MDAGRDRTIDKDLRLELGKLGGTRAPTLAIGIAREREEDIAMPDLGGRETRVEVAGSLVLEVLREELQALRATRLDHREHEQAIEQPEGLLLADLIAQRDRVVVAEIVRGWLLPAHHQLRDLDDVPRFIVREARHRGDEIRALGVAPDQRQRGLRRLALAVQMIGVDRIEVAERDPDPALVARDEWERITKRRCNVIMYSGHGW